MKEGRTPGGYIRPQDMDKEGKLLPIEEREKNMSYEDPAIKAFEDEDLTPRSGKPNPEKK